MFGNYFVSHGRALIVHVVFLTFSPLQMRTTALGFNETIQLWVTLGSSLHLNESTVA